MREEEIKSIELILEKITPYPWHKIIGRLGKIDTVTGKNVITYTRWDIYSGEASEITETTILQDIQRTLVDKKKKQIAHFHPETPTLYEKNENTENDMEFIVRAPEIVSALLCEIKRLQEEKQTQNEATR